MYGVVFYYTPSPKADTRATAKTLAEKYFSKLPFVTGFSKPPPFFAFQEEKAPLSSFPVPDTGYFQFAGRGLSAEDISGIQKTGLRRISIRAFLPVSACSSRRHSPGMMRATNGCGWR
jgi:hypothetical protein